ncbi:MAG: 50S ribosomal protein L37ae [DPANN group archaeon]|nr:50S ribosomal protein L37ae [DPANN group archaeon]
MADTTKSPAKRLGSRYGRRVRHKLKDIEILQKKSYKCPYCNAIRVRRLAAGIWQCSKCKAKFANKAYTVKAE